MKRSLFILVIFSLLFSAGPAFSDSDDWLLGKSRHFIVHYKHADEDFINKLIDKAEFYYDKIADDLGFRRFDFWLWDNRAKIYIHDDAEAYRSATGQPAWSSGCAMIREKMIHSFPFAKGFCETTLPHEMGHIIFREFVGFNNPAIPVWLDEGVASYQESAVYSMADQLVKEAIAQDKLIDLERLSQINPHSIKDDATVYLFYAEAVSIVDFLIKEFGQDNFILFCQNLRDKQDLERALSYVYPFKNIKELGRAWQEHIEHG